jgi:hypothetical protein
MQTGSQSGLFRSTRGRTSSSREPTIRIEAIEGGVKEGKEVVAETLNNPKHSRV